MLRAAEASARIAGGAREFTDTILVVVTATSRHRAACHLPSCCFTAETWMIAWKKDDRESLIVKSKKALDIRHSEAVAVRSPFLHSRQVNLPSGRDVRPRQSR